jgi:hypothetical protein
MHAAHKTGILAAMSGPGGRAAESGLIAKK